ncbi:unnamed protein product [Onchocerca flexuosa]|uniref:Ovule protein n=1 Tax=Onchocerca flexuosa TaxID=387005 RepID=A0A183I300_9BILA|nr:unnamed protein product [Onchocerca flexuosa]
MENESRATEMENFGAEKHDVRAGLVCAEQLSIRQMDFENRLRNLEKQYNKLACPTLEQPRVYGREETRRPEIDYSDMVEWPPRHWSSSGSKKVEVIFRDFLILFEGFLKWLFLNKHIPFTCF